MNRGEEPNILAAILALKRQSQEFITSILIFGPQVSGRLLPRLQEMQAQIEILDQWAVEIIETL